MATEVSCGSAFRPGDSAQAAVVLSAPAERALVSIIVPSFNQGRFIEETLLSILGQDYRPLEVLVMDGGSSDETVEILERFSGSPELSWISEPDKGVADAVNKGLTRARGDIVAIQSSDDLYLPGAISQVVALFRAHRQAGLVYGEGQYIDEDSRVIGRSQAGDYSLKAFLSRETFILQSSAFFRRELLATVGGWRKRYAYVADNEFWLRICTRFLVVKTDILLSSYRYHPSQRDTERERIVRHWKAAISESEDVARLPGDLRQSAEAGVCMTALHYLSERAWIRRHGYAWSAWLRYRVSASRIDTRDLVPGYRPVRGSLAGIKGYARRAGLLRDRPRT